MTDTTTKSPDIFSQLRQRYEQLTCEKEAGVLWLRAIFVYLRSKYPDLKRIEISYDGSGDSGQVESIHFSSNVEPNHWHEGSVDVDTSEVLSDELTCGRTARKGHFDMDLREWVHDEALRSVNIEEALDRIGWDIAYGENPGFEINEGGYGTVSVFIDPVADPDNISVPADIKVELSHSERYEATNDYSYSL